jgi:CheY-like chemotaxis protein
MLDIVMTIDDDSMGQMLSEIIMSDQQFCDSIVKLYDGKMALDYFEEQSRLPINEQKIPDLVLLDINMPILDGWDFLNHYEKEFKSFHDRTKIVVLTSSIDPTIKIRAEEHPLIFKYIAKPLEPKHLSELKIDPSFLSQFN